MLNRPQRRQPRDSPRTVWGRYVAMGIVRSGLKSTAWCRSHCVPASAALDPTSHGGGRFRWCDVWPAGAAIRHRASAMFAGPSLGTVGEPGGGLEDEIGHGGWAIGGGARIV